MDTNKLIERFAEANLELKISNKSLVRGGNGNIVQVDIARKLTGNMRDEMFQLYIGDDTSDVQVLSVDKDLSQLVLMVCEKARAYTRFANKKYFNKSSLNKGETVSEDKNGDLTISGKTSDEKVRYLMGRDERQLFIARLPKSITTVKEAHASLKGADVSFAEGKARGRTIRQGEWFCINVTEGERRAIQEAIKKNKAVVGHKVAIQRDLAGRAPAKPHTADELIRLPGNPLTHGWAVHSVEIFVRGKIRHTDHETVAFKEWRKVIKNAETGGGNGRWID
jgi:hypothetical protein